MGKRSFAWTKNCIYRLWESKRGIDRWKECQGIIIRKFIEPNSIWWGQCEKKIFLYLLWHSFKRCTNDLFYPKNRRYNLGIKNPCRNTQILRNAFTQYKSDYGKFFSRSKQYFFSLVFLMRIITTNCNITKLWGRKKKTRFEEYWMSSSFVHLRVRKYSKIECHLLGLWRNPRFRKHCAITHQEAAVQNFHMWINFSQSQGQFPTMFFLLNDHKIFSGKAWILMIREVVEDLGDVFLWINWLRRGWGLPSTLN